MKNTIKINNKMIAYFTMFMMVVTLFSTSIKNVFAEVGDIIQDDTFKYTVLDDNSVSLKKTIKKADIADKDIIIPSEVEGKKVVEIGSNAFAGCKLKSVVIPDTVVEIKESAFDTCSKLENIQIPNSVKEIGPLAFAACKVLKQIDLPNSITVLHKNLFSSCPALEKVVIPEGVTLVERSVFSDCESLTEVTIPKSLQNIEYPAFVFNHCTSLNTIKGYKGTYARTLSRELGCKFIALDASEDDKEFEIKFDADNGSDIVTQPVYKDEILNYTPGNITKKGYTFVGWYEDTDNITTEYKNNQTYTKDITYKAKWAHVEGLGAQVKVDKTGIRFGTKLYNDGDEILEKGTVMIPTKLIDTMTQWNITLDTKNAAKSIGKVNYEVNKDENYVVYLGTLINIPESQRDTYIRASSYVRYKDKSGNEYIVYAFNGEATINSLLESSN